MPPCAMRSSTGLRPGNGHRLGSPTLRPPRSSRIGALTSTTVLPSVQVEHTTHDLDRWFASAPVTTLIGARNPLVAKTTVPERLPGTALNAPGNHSSVGEHVFVFVTGV